MKLDPNPDRKIKTYLYTESCFIITDDPKEVPTRCTKNWKKTTQIISK